MWRIRGTGRLVLVTDLSQSNGDDFFIPVLSDRHRLVMTPFLGKEEGEFSMTFHRGVEGPYIPVGTLRKD